MDDLGGGYVSLIPSMRNFSRLVRQELAKLKAECGEQTERFADALNRRDFEAAVALHFEWLERSPAHAVDVLPHPDGVMFIFLHRAPEGESDAQGLEV